MQGSTFLDEQTPIPGLDPKFDAPAFRLAAVRASIGDAPRYSGELGEALHILTGELLQHHRFIGGTLALPGELIEEAYAISPSVIDGLLINDDPFKCDMMDCLALLVVKDFDHAHFQNGEGLSKSTSDKAHRLHNQFINDKKLTIADIEEVKDIIRIHYKQICVILAERNKTSDELISDILDQRKYGLSASKKIKDAIDDEYVFLNRSYLWFDDDAICVRFGPHVRTSSNELSQYRNETLRNGPLAAVAAAFYSVNNRPFVFDAKRTISGVTADYKYLKLPLVPSIVSDVIQISRRIDPKIMIDGAAWRLIRQQDDEFIGRFLGRQPDDRLRSSPVPSGRKR